MRRGCILFALALAGCIRSELVVCDNGVACPVDRVCNAQYGCIRPEQVAACAGQLPFAACTTADVIDGVCHDGVCLPGGCGTGRVDPLEACDDGNTTPGDGCAADCRSDESCGNGIVDLIKGERCDDGNHLGHDGCDSRCDDERLVWSTLATPAAPLRNRASYAYDTKRRRLVAFGGTAADAGRTYEWDGHGWSDRTPVLSPPARVLPLMVYDSDREVIVMFGGQNAVPETSAVYGDTWTWDGMRWTNVTPVVSPPGRNYGSMAYDATSHRTILFGGIADGALVQGTWAWDGAAWTELVTPSPDGRRFAAMGYDPLHGYVLLYGGQTFSFNAQDTWAWTGTSWTLLSTTAANTSGVNGAKLSFDPVLGEMALLGGTAATDGWSSWDGTAWRSHPSSGVDGSGAPPQPVGTFYDLARGHTLLIGRFSGVFAMKSLEVATDTWTTVAPPTGPPGVPVAFDPGHGRVLGYAAGVVWEHDGASWTCPTGAAGPSSTSYDFGFDVVRGRLVATGSEYVENSTWEWDGVQWSEVANTNPDSLSYAPIVYHRGLGALVRFGGLGFSNGLPGTLTMWTGSEWQVIDAPPRPSPRYGVGLAYDERRDRLVLFGGGTTAVGSSNDTWEWDGTWHEIPVASAPTPRFQAQLAYDVRRGEVVMYGGYGGNFGFTDFWRWDGARWHALETINLPTPAPSGNLVYDAARGDFVIGVHRLGWVSDGVYDDCERALDRDGDQLAGCADPDCAGECDPLCPPQTSCVADRPRCGDGACSVVETAALCPQDCPPAPPICGDDTCTGGETFATCPGDCGP